MNESDFRAAFEEHKDTVYRFAWRITNLPEAAEDITQDVFLALLRRPDRFDEARGELRAFLLGIAHNLMLKAFRRDVNRWVELDEDKFVAHPIEVADREIADMVGAAVRSLPPLQREVLVLEPLSDFELENLLSQWAAPSAPQRLKETLLRVRFRWWQWLLPGAFAGRGGRRSKRFRKV